MVDILGTAPRIITAATQARVASILSGNCSGWGCNSRCGTFTRRMINGAVTVHIQCEGCGRSLSGPLKRADFAHWQDFPEWDQTISKAHEEVRKETHLDWLETQREVNEQKAADAAQRRLDYRRWLLTSTEWRTLRDRVWRRAGGFCEACLGEKASDVHHVTYRLGRLPPAWELRAVCRTCHDRLHDWTGGEE